MPPRVTVGWRVKSRWGRETVWGTSSTHRLKQNAMEALIYFQRYAQDLHHDVEYKIVRVYRRVRGLS